MPRDPIIVIGAGMGGLAAALSLASRGEDVLVLERAAAPGGKMRRLDVAGRMIDGGPTVLTMRWVFEELFAAAGAELSAHVTLEPLRVLAVFSPPGPVQALRAVGDSGGVGTAEMRIFPAGVTPSRK